MHTAQVCFGLVAFDTFSISFCILTFKSHYYTSCHFFLFFVSVTIIVFYWCASYAVTLSTKMPKEQAVLWPLHSHFCGLFVKTHFPPSFSHLPISSSGKYSEYKPSWPPEPIGQNKLWKTNRNSSQLPRPPPGLTNQKQASPSPWGSGGPRLARSWGGGGINQESRFGQGTVYRENI